MSKVKIDCDNCKNGKTKYYHVLDGICFQCNGTGYIYLDQNKVNEIEQKKKELGKPVNKKGESQYEKMD